MFQSTIPLGLLVASASVWQSQGPPASPEPTPRQQVAAITAAIDRGRADSLRRNWESRVRRAPADPAGQFALATVDRLEYRHQAAQDRFALIEKMPGPAARPWRPWALLGAGLTRAQRGDGPGALVDLDRALAAADSIGDAGVAGWPACLGSPVPGRRR